MFKIKVGLKSFQTHSIQKCKYQIGQIVYYLKQSSPSFQSTSASPTMHLVHRAHFAKQDAEQNSVFYKGKIESMEEKKPTLVRDLFGVTPLPTLIKKMTTLRSPHIDKKSREQFEWKREKTQIHFHLTSVPQVSLVLFILMHSRFPGVELEIGVESKTYFA